VLGAKKAREMWMLCRRYSAQEAVEMGLANVAVPLDKIDDEVDKWCGEILEKSPTCIQVLKASFDEEFNYMRWDVPMALQGKLFPSFMRSEEQQEAQKAFFEKREPQFLRFREKDYEEYLRTRTKVIVK
jgi:1,4-dihydroxy-2-naphthoyl-CoA synthase